MLVSPAGPSPRHRVDEGIAILSDWGLKVELAPGALARSTRLRYLAGDDASRRDDLNAAFRDPAVRGVICTRGGYGAQRIVDDLDYSAIRADPKVLAGFSDVTALQMAIYRHCGLAGVQSPMAAWDAVRTGAESTESLRAALMTTEPVRVAVRADEDTAAVRIPGPPVSGTLLGGNLCLLASTIGTPDMPDLSGAILLLEEVTEPPYKVDRMLTHLRRAGALSGIVAVAVGQFTDCADDWPTTVVEVLMDRLGDLGVPVLGGLPIGHGREQVSVPVGVPAHLDIEAGTLTVQSAVE